MENQTLRLVMKFLRQRGYCESLVVLEKQSEISYLNYGKQVEFFKKILLRGDINQAAKFLATFEIKLDERDFKKIMVELYKQKLYELIQNPDQAELKFLFEREIVNYCSEQEYQVFFTYLTCKSVHDIPGMSDWTVTKGRLSCFQAIVPYFDGLIINGVPKIEDIQGNLDEIVSNHFKNCFTGNQSKSVNSNGNYYISNGSQKHIRNENQRQKQIHREFVQKQKESMYQQSLSLSSLGHKKLSPKISKQDLVQLQTSSFADSNMNSNGSQRNQTVLRGSEKLGLTSNKVNKKADRPLKDVKQSQIELSQSQFQKSQGFANQDRMQGAFEKRSKIYANLNPSTLTNQNFGKGKFDSSKEIDIDYKNSLQHQKRSQTFKNPYQSHHSQVQEKGYEEHQPSQRIGESREIKGLKESTRNVEYLYKKPSPAIEDSADYPSEVQGSLQEEAKKNIAYLEQNNSVVYKNEEQNENFTFSNNADMQQKLRKVTKLATISDQKAIRTCQFTDSGRYFALGTNSSLLKIFDIEELYLKNQFQQNLLPVYQIQNLHLKSIFCLQWSCNQKAVLTCSNDLTVRLTQFGEGMDSHRSNVIGRHQSCIRMVKFNNLESKIFSCDDKGLIKIWDLGKVTKCTDLKGHKDNGVSAFKLAQNQNEAILYSVGKDSLIKKWDLRTGKNQITSKKQESELTYIANNSNQIVVSHKNGTVSFFNSSLQLEYAEQIHQQEIRSIDANFIDESFITASFDGNISIFDKKSALMPFYHRHNETQEDKVVYATFLQHPDINGFASTSTLGLCHLYSYQ